MLKANNTAGLEVLLHHLRNNPNSRVSAGRTFLFGGSPNLAELAPGVFAGELSGIAARETPSWAGRDRYYPPPDLAAITDWGEKLDRLARDCAGKDIRSISGVPTWLQILFDRALEFAEVDDRRLVSLFPDLELIAHGGINFEPYEEGFSQLLRGSRAELREVYAASEGFIAVADRQYRQGMQLLMGNHQLRTLRHQHLVSTRRQGRHIYYSLADTHVRAIFEFALEHLRHTATADQ